MLRGSDGCGSSGDGCCLLCCWIWPPGHGLVASWLDLGPSASARWYGVRPACWLSCGKLQNFTTSTIIRGVDVNAMYLLMTQRRPAPARSMTRAILDLPTAS